MEGEKKGGDALPSFFLQPQPQLDNNNDMNKNKNIPDPQSPPQGAGNLRHGSQEGKRLRVLRALPWLEQGVGHVGFARGDAEIQRGAQRRPGERFQGRSGSRRDRSIQGDFFSRGLSRQGRRRRLRRQRQRQRRPAAEAAPVGCGGAVQPGRGPRLDAAAPKAGGLPDRPSGGRRSSRPSGGDDATAASESSSDRAPA